MKKILSVLAGTLLLMNLFVSTGCEEDPTTPEVKDPPILVIGSASDVAEGGTITVAPNTGVNVQLIGTAGTEDLESVRFDENGAQMDIARLDVTGGSTTVGSATALVVGSDATGFTWDAVFTASDVPGTYDHSITLADAGGLTSSTNFTIVVEDPGTPIEMTLTGVLFNQQGDPGTGSLDLDEGKGSGVTTDGEVPSTEAEIRDMGIDCTIPSTDFNWRRQIGGFNGTELVTVDLTQLPENFSFDGVQIKEDIQSAFDTGVIGTQQDAVDPFCDVTATVDYVTEPLSVGDLLAIKKGDKYYLIRVDAIEEDGGNTNTNEDNYTLSIKY